MLPCYALPALISAVSTLGLGVVSTLTPPHGRLQRAFALFCFAWFALSASAFAVQVGAAGLTWCWNGTPFVGRPTDPSSLILGRVPALFATLTAVLAHLYIVRLASPEAQLPERVGPLSRKAYLAALVAWLTADGLLTLCTSLVVRGFRFHPRTGYTIHFGPGALLHFVPLVALAAYALHRLYREIARIPPSARRSFLRGNLATFLAILFGAGLFTGILPLLGVPSLIVVFDCYTIATLIFFILLMRYQAAQVQEVLASLEANVELRTRELRHAQASLVQAQKMASLGELAAGLSHELNSPLGAIRSMEDTRARAMKKLDALVETCREMDENQRSSHAHLRMILARGDDVIRTGIERITTVLEQLRSFAGVDSQVLSAIHVNEVLDATISLMNMRLQGLNLVRRYGELPVITGVSRKLNEVFYNVLMNAVDATSPGGTIGVFTAAEDGHVVVRVADDGTGIAETDLPRVFDPGYTTKGVGVGSGLGLAICYQVLHEHGGQIHVESALGVGTKVSIRLPIEGRVILRGTSSPDASPAPLSRP